eukprot:g14161.t1
MRASMVAQEQEFNDALEEQKAKHDAELKNNTEIKKLTAEKEQLIGRVKTLEMEVEAAYISKRRNDKETALFREENEKLRTNANVLNATIRDLELAHSNVESEIIMETKVNTVLVRAQSIMDAYSNNEDKAICRVDMETLLHDFDRSSRKLLDAHDESNRHMSFVRSKLEQILTILGGGSK